MGNIRPDIEILKRAHEEMIYAKEPWIQEIVKVYEKSPSRELSGPAKRLIDALTLGMYDAIDSVKRHYGLEGDLESLANELHSAERLTDLEAFASNTPISAVAFKELGDALLTREAITIKKKRWWKFF